MEVFNYCPRVDPVGSTTFRTRVAQFGDGYAQRVADGINARTASWPLEFVGDEAATLPIVAFLDRHAGHRPFLWSPPLGGEQEFVAPDGYAVTAQGGGTYSLSVTFVLNNPAPLA